MTRPYSQVRKRSVVIDNHKTSITLEEAFFARLKRIAAERGVTVGVLVGEVDHARLSGPQESRNANLSSALRLFVLSEADAKAAGRECV